MNKQATVSLIGVFISSAIFYLTRWEVSIVFAVLFLGGYFDYLYETYKK